MWMLYTENLLLIFSVNLIKAFKPSNLCSGFCVCKKQLKTNSWVTAESPHVSGKCLVLAAW